MPEPADPDRTDATAAPTDDTEQARRRAMGASLGVSVLMLVGKLGAAVVTGSTAIFSDAAESIVHLGATGFATFSLWYAATPPDASHPYGHGKIAYFAAAVEGALIFAAALGILAAAVRDVLRGAEVAALGTGLAIIGGLTLVNLGLGLWLVRTGRRTNSLVLVSNGQHVLTDMWTSLGVVVGVALVWLTGWAWLDPLVALVVSANIFWTAGRLLRRALDGLMERADPEATRAILGELAKAKDEGLIGDFHQVRHRRINDRVWIDAHLLFDGNLPLTEAHARSHAVEDRLDALFPDDRVHVNAHLEPLAHPHGDREPADALRDDAPQINER